MEGIGNRIVVIVQRIENDNLIVIVYYQLGRFKRMV